MDICIGSFINNYLKIKLLIAVNDKIIFKITYDVIRLMYDINYKRKKYFNIFYYKTRNTLLESDFSRIS